MPAALPFLQNTSVDLSANSQRESLSLKQSSTNASFAENLQNLQKESIRSEKTESSFANAEQKESITARQSSSEETGKINQIENEKSEEEYIAEEKEQILDEESLLLELQTHQKLKTAPKKKTDEIHFLGLTVESSKEKIQKEIVLNLDESLLSKDELKESRMSLLKVGVNEGKNNRLNNLDSIYFEDDTSEMNEKKLSFNSSVKEGDEKNKTTYVKELSFSEQKLEKKSSGENKTTFKSTVISSQNSFALQNTARTDGGSTLKTGMPQALLEQVVSDSHLRLAVQKSSARIHLPMADGSELALKLSIKGGMVDVKVVGENSDVLLHKSAELRASLQAEGLDLRALSKISDVADTADSLNVDVNDEKDAQNTRHGSTESDERQEVDEFLISEDGTLLATPYGGQPGLAKNESKLSTTLDGEEHETQNANSLANKGSRRRVHIRA